jgi:hypothetical protein
MTGVFWTFSATSTANCSVDGVPLKCNIWQDQSEVSAYVCGRSYTIDIQ